MWKMVDYHGGSTSDQTKNKRILPSITDEYFKCIFQEEHLKKNPTVGDIEQDVNSYSVSHPHLDQDFSYKELNYAIVNIGRGIGLDGSDKNIAQLFTKKLRMAILRLFNKVYASSYPSEWSYLILRPEVKKGHTIEKPKLRGVAISSLLPTLYDIMIDNRFKLWYEINPEQAGFREGQGCLIQLFAIYLLMELARVQEESLFIGFIDYEKAFDYVNRADIVKDLIAEEAGTRFTKAVSSMYQETFYVPKISGDRIGDPMLARHGVTQGRKSSTSLFSFAMRNVPKSINLPRSFLQGNHVFQLADDSAIVTNSFRDLKAGFDQLIEASNKKHMVTNVLKTHYLHLSEEPLKQQIHLSGNRVISYADNDEHIYLGMWFTSSIDIVQQIKCNLSHRAFNISKFTDWLNVNLMTPIKIKIHVLDSCMFAAYLYGCECWAKIDDLVEDILLTERKLLRQILQVKSSTPNEIIYAELDRCNMVSKIKQRQKKSSKRRSCPAKNHGPM